MSISHRVRRASLGVLCLIGAMLGSTDLASAGDWPMWRHDAGRSAASPAALPGKLAVHWSRALPPLEPAWVDQPKLQFDLGHEPIVAGRRALIGSSHDNSLAAFDTRSGDELWRFFADGPIRFAPLAWKDRVYFASDDGHLYCLHAADGRLLWRVRGGPADRLALGNERLISAWPSRGAPALVDGTIYFAAGIWPFMGVFIHAVDAESGDIVWTNDGDSSIYVKQPHNTDSFAGVAPHGPLAVAGETLLVPGGRSVPAAYDRQTGRFLHYELGANGKRGGGYAVSAVDDLFFNGGVMFDLRTGLMRSAIGERVVFADGRLYGASGSQIRTWDLTTNRTAVETSVDRKGQKVEEAKWSMKQIGENRAPAFTALIQAGERLYAGQKGKLLAYDLPLPPKGDVSPAWEIEIEGTPWSLAAADDRLWVTTLEGELLCMGDVAQAPAAPQHHDALPVAADPPSPDTNAQAEAAAILAAAEVRDGYALCYGAPALDVLRELVAQSEIRWIVLEPDAERADALRRGLRVADIGAAVVTVIAADSQNVLLPPYLASLSIVQRLPASVEQSKSAEQRSAYIAGVFASLRPFGGRALLPAEAWDVAELQRIVEERGLANAELQADGSWIRLTRAGALPGSADWTHEHADAANTRVSKDQLVRAPLGLLWFGGPSNDAILPRHGHGPQPQVLDGRLFIEGMDMLRCTDIYTGRLLWETSLPGVGKLYDNTAHQPGANASGTNYISTREGIYVAYKRSCVLLDVATGKQLREFRLPAEQDAAEGNAAGAEPPTWGYINVDGDYLIGGADPLFDESQIKSRDSDNYSSSRRLTVFQRHTGDVLWSIAADSGFRHNAVVIGGGRLYCIDRLSGGQLARLKRRGEEPGHPARLRVFDLASGRELWSTERDVFGTWLSYSAEHDILIEAGRVARDSLTDEPRGMRAYRAADGEEIWHDKSHAGPAMIHRDGILMAGTACDLLTGALRMREHPLSGESVPWLWSRNYGCNTPMASEHLLTFRSGAAGYFDLCNDGGTGNFGGFRSSCTNNLVVAGGIISAPDYTRTCTCNYQNQTSIALVHMPEVEIWTSFGQQTAQQPIRRLGINLGAPGDRKGDDGLLWLEYPSVGGASPPLTITVEPADDQPPEAGLNWFRRHSSQASGDGLPWVASSGVQGLRKINIALAKDEQARRYSIRLHFLEPDDALPGERRFDVRIEGRPVLQGLDVVQEAGGRMRGWVKEFAGVEVAGDLTIELTPSAGSKRPAPVLSGVEIQAEGW